MLTPEPLDDQPVDSRTKDLQDDMPRCKRATTFPRGSDWDSSKRILFCLLVNNDSYGIILLNYGKFKFFVWTVCGIEV